MFPILFSFSASYLKREFPFRYNHNEKQNIFCDLLFKIIEFRVFIEKRGLERPLSVHFNMNLRDTRRDPEGNRDDSNRR